MNECLFLFHSILIALAILASLRIGKYAIITFFAVEAVLANLFVSKQMVCFGLTITCTDVYAIGALLSLNVLQESFGRKAAREAVWIALFISLLFIILSKIHLYYLPSPIDTTQNAFSLILGNTPRIILVSIAVAFAAERLDVILYEYAKKKFPKFGLAPRFFLTALITQFFDTVAFSFLGLYGIVYSILDVILVSYLVKVIIIFCMAPFSLLAKKVHKHGAAL